MGVFTASNISFKQNGPLSQAPREPKLAANAAAPAKWRDILGLLVSKMPDCAVRGNENNTFQFAQSQSDVQAQADINDKITSANKITLPTKTLDIIATHADSVKQNAGLPRFRKHLAAQCVATRKQRLHPTAGRKGRVSVSAPAQIQKNLTRSPTTQQNTALIHHARSKLAPRIILGTA